MRHGRLPTQDEAKWQLDFLARWKAKKCFIYSEGAIELDGYPVLNPKDGSLRSKSGGSIPPSSIRSARIRIRSDTSTRPEGAAMEIRGKVIEQIV